MLLKRLLYNTLTDMNTPILALFVIALTSMICSTMLSIKKFNIKLKPACPKVGVLLGTIDNTYQETHTKYSLSYLHKTIENLAKQTAIYGAKIEEGVLCDKLTKFLDRHAFFNET